MYKDMCKLPTVVQVLLSCVLPRCFLQSAGVVVIPDH